MNLCINRRFLLLSSLAASATLMAACSGPYTISADVKSFGQIPEGKAAPVSYAFERLPSQQTSKRQFELEAGAREALEKAGLKPAADNKSADVLVTLGARLTATEYSPWNDPLWWHWRGGFGGWRYGPWRSPSVFAYSPYGPGDRRYDREVAVLLRDRASGDLVYEAHASYDSITMGDGETTAALFKAALVDYPRANPEGRRVTVQMVR